MTPRHPDMDMDRFHRLAGIHGGDLRRWPVDERAAATALLGRDPAASAVLARAGAVDTWLASDVVPAPPPRLRRRLLADAHRRVRPSLLRRMLGELGGPRIAGPALAAGLMLGVGAAWVLEPAADDALATAEAPDYAELAQLEGAYLDYLP